MSAARTGSGDLSAPSSLLPDWDDRLPWKKASQIERPDTSRNPPDTLDQLGAAWSPDLDAYAGRYCSATCRHAHRERVRQAQAVAQHAAELADAQAAVAVLWPQIEPAGSAVAELAIDMAVVCRRGSRWPPAR